MDSLDDTQLILVGKVDSMDFWSSLTKLDREALKRVKRLLLIRCTTGTSIWESLAAFCEDLEEVEMHACKAPRDREGHMYYGLLQVIAHPGLKSLKRVTLRNSPIGGVVRQGGLRFHDAPLPREFDGKPKLTMERLVIQNEYMPLEEFEAIALAGCINLCPNLKHLHLRTNIHTQWAYSIRDAIFGLSHLNVLELGSFKSLLMVLPGLQRHLVALSILDIDAESYRAIGALFDLIETAPGDPRLSCDDLYLEYIWKGGPAMPKPTAVAELFAAKRVTIRMGTHAPKSLPDTRDGFLAGFPHGSTVELFHVTSEPVSYSAWSNAPSVTLDGEDKRMYVTPSSMRKAPSDWTPIEWK